MEKQDGASDESSSINSEDLENDPGEYFHPPLRDMLSECSSEFGSDDAKNFPVGVDFDGLEKTEREQQL